MKRIYLIITPLIFASVFVTNCNRKVNAKASSTDKKSMTTQTKNGITLTEVNSLGKFDDATIAQSTGSTGSENLDNNKVVLNYTTTNFEFGNTGNGQHIVCIADNQTKALFYKNTETLNLPEDGQHIVLSFFARANGISIKQKNAYTIVAVITGKTRYYARYAAPDLDKPMLFYNSPDVEIKDNATDGVLLDFYLVNCDLSADGYKVKADINGASFILTKWTAYAIHGLAAGGNSIKLTLLDKDNKEVESRFSTVERKLKLSK